jgi:hypothetical protein
MTILQRYLADGLFGVKALKDRNLRSGYPPISTVKAAWRKCGVRTPGPGLDSPRSPFLDNFRLADDTSVTNQIKEMAQRSELYLLRRAHGIYSNLVSLLTLGSIEALYLAGKGNSRIDVNVM